MKPLSKDDYFVSSPENRAWSSFPDDKTPFDLFFTF